MPITTSFIMVIGMMIIVIEGSGLYRPRRDDGRPRPLRSSHRGGVKVAPALGQKFSRKIFRTPPHLPAGRLSPERRGSLADRAAAAKLKLERGPYLPYRVGRVSLMGRLHLLAYRVGRV